MRVTSISTPRISSASTSLLKIIDAAVPDMEEGSVLAVTSKIVAIAEGRTVSIKEIDKHALIRREAEYYLPPERSKYGITLTIKDDILIPTAGIDESNADESYVLWPSDAQATANQVREHLANTFKLQQVGVIITDSKTTPLRFGTTGIALAHSGFDALNNYVGKPDIFGRPLKVTRANIMDMLAASAVAVMGEGNEQTPLAYIQELSFVRFVNRNPTPEELALLRIGKENDLYGPLLQGVGWQKGGAGHSNASGQASER